MGFKKQDFLVLGLPLLVIAGLFFLLYTFWLSPRMEAWKFRKVLTDYINVDYSPSKRSVEKGAIPYRTGKILVVEKRKGKYWYVQNYREPPSAHIDPAWYKLPMDIRATSPEQLDTLIITQYQRVGDASKASGKWKLSRKRGDTGFSESRKELTVKVFDMNRRFLIGTWKKDDLPVFFNESDKKEVVKIVKNFLLKMPVKNSANKK